VITVAALTVVVERRLVLVISAVVFVDTMVYAVIAPLLPALAREAVPTRLRTTPRSYSRSAGSQRPPSAP